MYTNYSQLNMFGMGSGMNYQNFLGNGFGMSGFGMSGFGMGSLFGTGFGGCNMFQSCDGSYNYDAMAGMAVGGVLTNCLFGFLGQVVSNRQAKKAAVSENSVESLTKKVADQQAVVDKKDSVKKSAQAKVDEVNTKISTLNSDLSTLNTDLNSLKNDSTYSANKTKLKELLADVNKQGVDQTQLKASIDIVKGEIADHEKKISAKEAEIASKKKEVANLEAESSKLDKALKEATESYETENDELTALKNELKDAKTSVKNTDNKKILNNADGNMFTRSSSKRMTEKHKVNEENGSLTSYQISTSDITKGDIAYALNKFQNMTKDEGKTKWAKMYQELYLQSGDVPTKTQRQAYEQIIKPWLETHKA